MVELFNRLKLVRERDTGLVTSLTFDGKEVLVYNGVKYVTTGDSRPFLNFCQEAQEEFDASSVGKYCDYLEDEEGLGELPFEVLDRLYKYHNSLESGPFTPTALSRLEKFKKSIPKGVPIFTAVTIFLATFVTATVILVKRESKRASKTAEKVEKSVEESKTIPPLVKPIVKAPIVVAREVTSTVSSYPWIPLTIVTVGLFTLIKYGRSTSRSI